MKSEVSTMIVNSFQIDEALQLKPLSVEELSEARTTADARIWIDLQGFEPSEFEDWLDRRIGDLRSGFQMNAQDKTNRRLNLLTVLSAIFTPITLLAGIWGMNFETMPELKFPFAYPIAVGLMVLIGAGMYQYFRREGWFD